MKNLIFTGLGILLLASCSSVKFNSQKDGDVDFSKFKTISYYGWTKESDSILNAFDKKRIEEAFAKEFENRGLTFIEKGGDLIVSLFIVVDQKTGTTAYTNHYGAGGPYGYYGGFRYGVGWGWGMGYSTTSYSDYDYYVGTLIVDVFDSATKELVWQGTVSGQIDDNPKSRERNIPRVAKVLMQRYPVKPIKK